jgi:septal ring factor EnvC (AmiA/AmiB activator)
MKAVLVNLLIVLSLGLCAFNAVQWHREAKLRGRIEAMASEAQRQSDEIQNLQLSLKVSSEEIQRLEALRDSVGSTLQSNRALIARLEAEADQLRADAQLQAAIILSQNEKLKQLADERNDIVTRFNKLAADYKSLGDDYAKVLGMYTNLVAEVEAANRRNR